MTAALQSSTQAPPVRLSHCRRHNGTAELAPSDPKPVLVKPILQLSQLRFWQDELNYWQLEVDFFCRLLTLEISNCKSCKRSRLEEVRLAFTAFKQEILPGMRTSLEETLSGAPAQNGFHPSSLQKKIEEHAETLKKMKLEVFPCLSELLTVTIW